MQNMHFFIHIDAPKEKVWNTMLEDSTYRIWTEPFAPGSHYEGNWQEGSEMHFLGADPTTSMYSRIKENRLYEFISIEHIGISKQGVIDTTSDEVKKWVPACENYTFIATDNGTEVTVDMDINEEYKARFEEMWPQALQILKTLAEK